MEHKSEKIEALLDLIASLSSKEDCRALFDDLCTNKELENMAERLHVAKLLIAGNTYSQVMEQADISSATLSRVSRCVQYGEGYRKFAAPQEPEEQ